jgi:hypothetical protein
VISTRTLTLDDALFVVRRMREADRRCVRALLGEVTDEVFALSRWQTDGPAWTLVQDGAPAAIYGLSYGTPGVATAWLVASDAMAGRSWRKVLSHSRIIASNAFSEPSRLHRIQASTLGGWAEAERFALRLGFQAEGVRRRAGSGGEDIHEFGLIQES